MKDSHIFLLIAVVVALAITIIVGREIYAILSAPETQKRSRLECAIISFVAIMLPWGCLSTFCWILWIGK